MSEGRSHAGRGRAALGLVAVAGAALLVFGCQPSEPPPAPGPAVPASQDAATGAQADFLKRQNLQGRVAAIQFGLMECALSDAGLDNLIRLCREEEIPGLAYVRVEGNTDTKAVTAYYEAKAPGFPWVHDADASVAKAFQATIYPTVVLVDKFGHVRYRGPMPEDLKLIDWAGDLMDEKTDPGPQAPMFGVTQLALQKLLDETRLPSLEDEPRPLRSYMGQQGLVAVFVDAQCPFAGEAVADMSKVATTLAQHKVAAVLVNLADPKAAVTEYYRDRKTGSPVLYDVTEATQKAWLIDGVPTVMFFDARGNLIYRGKAVWRNLARAAETVLGLAAGSVDFGVAGTEFG